MYKTMWYIYDGNQEAELIAYHFGKEPRFPSRYLQEETTYEIEMLWNISLIATAKIFFKCLFHKYIIR